MKASVIFFSFLLFGLILASIFPSKVSAERNRKYTLGVSPAYTDIVLDNSETIKKVQFTLMNRSKNIITLHLYPLDIKQVGEDGKIELIPLTVSKKMPSKYGLSSHLSIDSPRFELEPDESREIQVTIRNDSSLSPGGHYAAVVSEMEINYGGNSSPGLLPGIITQIFAEKVGGDRPTLELVNVSWPSYPIVIRYPSNIDLLFHNRGNIHLIPYGKVQIKDMFSRVIYAAPINESSAIIFPEQRRNISVLLQKQKWSLPISYNTMIIEGFDSREYTAFHSEKEFLYIDPITLVLFVILVTLLIKFKQKIKYFFSKQRLTIRKSYVDKK